MEVEKLETTLEVNARKLRPGLEEAQRLTSDYARKMDSILSGVGQNFGRSGFLDTLSKISNVIQGIPAVGQLAHALVTPMLDAAKAGVMFNATLESAQASFTGIIGDSDRALAHLNKLQAFAEKTPFEFTGLLKSSRYMNTFGFAITEHIPKLTAWGNAIAASGELSEETLMGVVRAFGQMTAKGRTSAEEMEQLAERGIPSWELLSKAIGKSVEETRKLSEQGRLKGRESMEAITAMMRIDPRFANQMEIQSHTLLGLMSNAEDLKARALGMGTRTLTADIKKSLEAGLSQSGTAEAIAASVNATIAPVSGLVKTAAVGLLGGGITSGLREGIEAGKGIVESAITDLGLGAIGKFAKLFGINSPSLVFKEFGINIAEGLSLGLQEGMQQQDPASEFEKLLNDPRIKALLAVIKTAEGGDPKTLYGGAQWGGSMDSFPQWSGKKFYNSKTGRWGTTHAAGSYQFQPGTYAGIGREFGLPSDFGERSQDLHAVALLKKIGALDALFSKGFGATIPLLGSQWASIPGNLPGNKLNPHTLEKLYARSLADGSYAATGGGWMDGGAGRPASASGSQWPFFGRSASDPVPVRVVDIGGGAAFFPVGTAEEMDRAGGFGGDNWPAGWPKPSGKLMDGINLPSSAERLGVFNLDETVYRNTLKFYEDIGVEVRDVGHAFEETQPGIGEWFKIVSGSGIDVYRNLKRIENQIPRLSEQLKGVASDAPHTIGGIFGDAARNSDGTLKGFGRTIALGFADALRETGAQILENAVTKGASQIMQSIFKPSEKGVVAALDKSFMFTPLEEDFGFNTTAVTVNTSSTDANTFAVNQLTAAMQTQTAMQQAAASAQAGGGGFWSGLLKAVAGGVLNGLAPGLGNIFSSIGNGTSFSTSVVGAEIFSPASTGMEGFNPGGIISHARGAMIPATFGGKLIRVAEGGFSEMVLSTDPKYKDRTAGLLARFIDRTNIVPKYAAGGWADGANWRDSVASLALDRSDHSYSPHYTTNNNYGQQTPAQTKRISIDVSGLVERPRRSYSPPRSRRENIERFFRDIERHVNS
jgi:tape measure domain-containing protein